MKTHALPIALAAALAALCPVSSAQADDAATATVSTAETSNLKPETSSVVTTLLSDGSTNSWTQADLVAALQLMNRKYHRDVETDAGRKAWHGKLVTTVVDTNALVKVTTYEDGTEFRDPFKVITPVASAQARAAQISVSTNGLPARLAAARLRRATEKAAVSNVTVIVNARAEAEQAARIAAAIAEEQAQAAAAEAAAATNAAMTAAALDALTGEAPALGETTNE